MTKISFVSPRGGYSPLTKRLMQETADLIFVKISFKKDESSMFDEIATIDFEREITLEEAFDAGKIFGRAEYKGMISTW